MRLEIHVKNIRYLINHRLRRLGIFWDLYGHHWGIMIKEVACIDLSLRSINSAEVKYQFKGIEIVKWIIMRWSLLQ